jgi:hypothetical protein
VRYPLFSLLIFFSAFKFSAAAKVNTDSLKALVLTSANDTNKVNLYYKLSGQYDYFSSKEKVTYLVSALELSQQINFERGIKRNSFVLITVLFHRGMYDLSMQYCLKYLSYLEENNFTDDIDKLNNTIGNLHYKQGNNAEAYSYYQKAKQYYLKINDQDNYGKVMNNISLIKQSINDFDSSFYYSNLAIDAFTTTDNNLAKANSILSVAFILNKRGSAKLALKKANDAYQIYKTNNVALGKFNSLITISEIYSAAKQYDSAIVNLSAAKFLADTIKLNHLYQELYRQLADNYFNIGDFKNAYNMQALYSQYTDTVNTAKISEKAIEMDVKYDISKKEIELSRIQSEKKLQQNILIVVSLGLLLLLALTFYIFKLLKVSRMQKKAIEEKQNEILDSIRYAKRIQTSLLTPEKYIEKNITRLKK